MFFIKKTTWLVYVFSPVISLLSLFLCLECAEHGQHQGKTAVWSSSPRKLQTAANWPVSLSLFVCVCLCDSGCNYAPMAFASQLVKVSINFLIRGCCVAQMPSWSSGENCYDESEKSLFLALEKTNCRFAIFKELFICEFMLNLWCRVLIFSCCC